YKAICNKVQGNIKPEQLQELRRSKEKACFEQPLKPAAGAHTKSKLFDKKSPAEIVDFSGGLVGV
ncbi:MAG: hypothetical protein RR063_11010, partial [Anaerovoracaceae bacterium]